MNKPIITVWDTESTDLYATWGRLLCFTWMNVGDKKPSIIRISDFPLFKEDPTNDRELVKAIKKVLDKSDMWFTWFGTKHDVPLVNSRLLAHNLAPLSPAAHVDGWRVAKDKLRMPRNTLAIVSRFMGVPEKTPIKDEMWVRARAGHLPSLNYVYEHGLQDALVTMRCYERMLPIIPNHPNVYGVNDITRQCTKCGVEGKLKRDGYGYAQKCSYVKYYCNACHSYTRGQSIKPGEAR